MKFRTSKIALGRTACLIALLLGTGTSLSYAQDGCSNPPPNVEATPGPTPTLAPKAWDKGLGIGVVADSDGTQATTSGPAPEGGQPLFDGRMTAPEDQTDDEADPAKVQVGKRLSCAVEGASDSDHWSQEDGQPCKANPDGIEDDGVHYTWTASGGSFEGPLDNEGHETFVSSVQGQGANWVAPTTPGKYTLSCTIDDTATTADDPNTEEVETGNRDDDAITRSCVVTVYGFSLRFLESEVAAGNIDNSAHQATYEITASDGTNPVADVEVNIPTIHSGGLSPSNSSGSTPSAKCKKDDEKTNALGKALGTFTSGNRVETTTIKYEGATASINQVWNNKGAESWTFDPYFDYNEASTVTYEMAYSRGAIPGHAMHVENTSISGWELVLASYDWDGDGTLDDTYWPETFTPDDEDLTGWNAYNGLSEWSDTNDASDGIYDSLQTIWWSDDFIVDDIWFDIVDDVTYGPTGVQS